MSFKSDVRVGDRVRLSVEGVVTDKDGAGVRLEHWYDIEHFDIEVVERALKVGDRLTGPEVESCRGLPPGSLVERDGPTSTGRGQWFRTTAGWINRYGEQMHWPSPAREYVVRSIGVT